MSETDHATRICVPVCEKRASLLPQALGRARSLGDLVELRLDCLEESELTGAIDALPALMAQAERPLILTLRPRSEGGHSALSDSARLDFWTEHFPDRETPQEVFADLELSLAELLCDRERAGNETTIEWERVICSHHDFAGVPGNLDQIYERMKATPARLFKIAVRANNITDCIAIFNLLERAEREERTLIAVGMGTAGIPTRILGPANSSYLTYAASGEGHETAPGQLDAASLRSLYRVESLNRETLINGLVGLPVLHSVSPQMHNAAFAALGLNAVYLPFEVRELDQFLKRMVHPRTSEMKWKLRGLSVTAPHKCEALTHLDWLDEAAREIGAVNTILVQDRELRGYNTDAAALLAPLEEKIGPARDSRVALIGAGGAARAALWGLKRSGASVQVFARNRERGEALASQFGVRCEGLEGTRFGGFDVVINATPLGTRGEREHETPALVGQLRGARLAYDLVYNPSETRFMREAREAGCDSLGGLPMLVAQAAAQFKLWTNMEAPRELMARAAAHALAGQEDKGPKIRGPKL